MRRAVFLDRDGTINREVGYLGDPEALDILPGVSQAVKSLKEAGWLVIVISNQSGIGRGYITRKQVESVNQRMREILATEGAPLDAIYYCPHHPNAGCACRKPEPGLILQAAADWGIDLRRSYVIGDKGSDIEMGHRVGCRTILVLTGHGKETQGVVEQVDFIALNLSLAVRWILEKEKVS